MRVKELMNIPFVIDKNISLSEAAKIMSSKRIGCLLFVSGDKIKGIVTERDLLKNFSKESKFFTIMKREVITIDSAEDVESVLEIFKENNIKRLPVTEKGKLVGIITLTDIAAHVEELEGDFFFD